MSFIEEKTATLVLSKLSLRCAIRNEPVEALPEELVRQQLLHHMINELRYPKGYLAVEKALSQMPHLSLSNQEIPDRRVDIICFAKGIHPQHDLFPLLVIECKSVKITDKVLNQVVGYNHHLQSPFIAVANQEEIRTGWFDPSSKRYTYIAHLPTYTELLTAIQSS